MRSVRLGAGDAWGPAALVSALNTFFIDASPRLSEDGLTIYLSSDRPGGFGASDVWQSTRAGTMSAWQMPADVATLNSASDDRTATPCAGGGLFVLSSNRGGASFDLYEAIGAVATPIIEINDGAAGELSPFITEDCLTLYFSSNRAGTYDLYVAQRDAVGDPYGAVTKITELSTDTADETDPWVSADGHHIVFTSATLGSDSNLVEAFR